MPRFAWGVLWIGCAPGTSGNRARSRHRWGRILTPVPNCLRFEPRDSNQGWNRSVGTLRGELDLFHPHPDLVGPQDVRGLVGVGVHRRIGGDAVGVGLEAQQEVRRALQGFTGGGTVLRISGSCSSALGIGSRPSRFCNGGMRHSVRHSG